VGLVNHIELRPLDEDDLDAVFEMMRDHDAITMAAFTAADPDDRGAFDAWIARQRNSPDVLCLVVTENGGFAGTAAAFTIDGDREVSYWIARHAWGRGVATEALRHLISREPIRPLFARAAAHNAASIAVLTKVGFTEVSRDIDFAPGLGREVEEIVFTLVPALDGS
jgi:RimJ/RimL family protein N-acetyltransferase